MQVSCNRRPNISSVPRDRLRYVWVQPFAVSFWPADGYQRTISLLHLQRHHVVSLRLGHVVVERRGTEGEIPRPAVHTRTVGLLLAIFHIVHPLRVHVRVAIKVKVKFVLFNDATGTH